VGDDGTGDGLVNDVLIEFHLPDEIMSLNKLPATRWQAKKHRERKNHWLDAAYYAAVSQLPGGPSKRRMPPCKVFVSLPVWGQRTRDSGNFTLTTKPILDGLVLAGLWPDDGPEWVAEQPVSFRVIKNREEAMRAKVIVRLVEL